MTTIRRRTHFKSYTIQYMYRDSIRMVGIIVLILYKDEIQLDKMSLKFQIK